MVEFLVHEEGLSYGCWHRVYPNAHAGRWSTRQQARRMYRVCVLVRLVLSIGVVIASRHWAPSRVVLGILAGVAFARVGFNWHTGTPDVWWPRGMLLLSVLALGLAQLLPTLSARTAATAIALAWHWLHSYMVLLQWC